VKFKTYIDMLLSQYLLPTFKNVPNDAKIKSHQLMLRCGLIKLVASGIYSWLPLGIAALRNIENIVREEMDDSGALEVLLPTIQPAELWRRSGRYDAESELITEALKAKDRANHDMIFSPTAEEAVCDLFEYSLKSYKGLPVNLYQISWKFRDEIRPRYGTMRAREFYMKDAYSFDIDKDAAFQSYQHMFRTYLRIFQRVELDVIPAAADTGSMGGEYSHEFHIATEIGENTIYYESEITELIKSGVNDFNTLSKIYSKDISQFTDDDSRKYSLNHTTSTEIGHIFCLGDKYSKSMNIQVQDRDGNRIHPQMGCYGIGISRLLAAIIEKHSDQQGIVWPKCIAPFSCAVINLHMNNEDCCSFSNNLYNLLKKSGIKVIMDDRSKSPGEKLHNADLLGMPLQIIISSDLIANNRIEIKFRQPSSISETLIDNKFITADLDRILHLCKLHESQS